MYLSIAGWCGIGVLLILVAAAGWMVFDRIVEVPPHELAIGPAHPLTAQEWIGARSANIQLLGIIVQLISGFAVATGVIFAWRDFTRSRNAHLDDRYSRAVGHLASDKIEVRVGAILELEKIVLEREDQWGAVTSVLGAFVSEESKRANPVKDVPYQLHLDLQVALATIQRLRAFASSSMFFRIAVRNANFDKACLDGYRFDGLDLTGSSFVGAQLSRATFNSAELADVNMGGSRATEASFAHTSVEGLSLAGSDLTGASFRRAVGRVNLSHAKLTNADCEWTFLGGSDLRGAQLDGTYLWEANLTYVNLNGVDLSKTKGITEMECRAGKTNAQTVFPNKTRTQAFSERSFAARSDPRG